MPKIHADQRHPLGREPGRASSTTGCSNRLRSSPSAANTSKATSTKASSTASTRRWRRPSSTSAPNATPSCRSTRSASATCPTSRRNRSTRTARSGAAASAISSSPASEILVQIAKEQFANKPPTLTTFYSLPGRYLVLLPGSDETGISRRIEGEERQRLRKLVEDLNPPEGFGLIVRTAAGLDEETGELKRDLDLSAAPLGERAGGGAAQARSGPGLPRARHRPAHHPRSSSLPTSTRSTSTTRTSILRARDFLRNVMPGKEHVLHCYRGEQPIFSAFDVEAQIDSVFKRRVPLQARAAPSSSTAPRR